MKNGGKFGKITGIFEQTIDDKKFIKAVVELEAGRVDNILITAPAGINWKPQLNDIVQVNYDEKGNATLGSVAVPIQLSDTQNIVLQNIRGNNILEFANASGAVVGCKVDYQGYIGNKTNLQAPIHATLARLDDLRIDKSLSPTNTGTSYIGDLAISVNGSTIYLKGYQ